MSDLFSVPVALILTGVWVILFGMGETSEVLDYAFGAAITFIGARPFLENL